MNSFDTFQRNNLVTGTDLAAELQASSPELRAFIVVGAYRQTSSGPTGPSKFLNVEQRDVFFWMRKYEVSQSKMEQYISDDDLLHSIHITRIESIDKLEEELRKYIQDFSSMEAAWKTACPLP